MTTRAGQERSAGEGAARAGEGAARVGEGAARVGEGAAEAALDAAVDRSGRALSEATAGRALCRADGTGGPAPFFVKRAEGDLAALMEVRRRLRRAPELSLLDVADVVLAGWRADLARWRERGSGPWIAYCEGGCAAVEAVTADRTAADAPGGAMKRSGGTSIESPG